MNCLFTRACACDLVRAVPVSSRVRLTFPARNLFTWRHIEKISFLLFRRVRLSAFIIKSFSQLQRLHLLPPAVYAFTRFRIDQLVLKDRPVFFSFHMCLDSSVSLEYVGSLKDF